MFFSHLGGINMVMCCQILKEKNKQKQFGRRRRTLRRIWRNVRPPRLTQISQSLKDTCLSTLLLTLKTGQLWLPQPVDPGPASLSPLPHSPRGQQTGVRSLTWDIQRSRFSLNEYLPAICAPDNSDYPLSWYECSCSPFSKHFHTYVKKSLGALQDFKF